MKLRPSIISFLQATVVLAVSPALPLAAQDSSEKPDWKRMVSLLDLEGTEHVGTIRSADQQHVVIEEKDGTLLRLRRPQLSIPSRRWLDHWREDHPEAPWIVPDFPNPWPRSVGPGQVQPKFVSSDPAKPVYRFETPRYILDSDAKLAPKELTQLASALEATKDLIASLPLGLEASPVLPPLAPTSSPMVPLIPPHPSGKMLVALFATPEAYGLAGGSSGSGGGYAYWNRRILISLANLGIGPAGRTDVPPLNQQIFVIKHEVTHQIMHDWLPFIPVWLNEGFSDCIASVPYQEGVYDFTRADRAFIDYLNKWRTEGNMRDIEMKPVSDLLNLRSSAWQAAVKAEQSHLNYNSSALLVWYFLRQDGNGDGQPLMHYFEAVRSRPFMAKQAVETHLLRGRNPKEIDAEIRRHWAEKGVTIIRSTSF